MLATAELKIASPPLPPLSEKPRLGHSLPTALLYPGMGPAISNAATGLPHPNYDFCSGPLSSGYFRDAATGLDYADQRYHQPGVGRFMTPDPSNHNVSYLNPGSLNRYAYVNGDPINTSDPTGLGGDGFSGICGAENYAPDCWGGSSGGSDVPNQAAFGSTGACAGCSEYQDPFAYQFSGTSPDGQYRLLTFDSWGQFAAWYQDNSLSAGAAIQQAQAAVAKAFVALSVLLGLDPSISYTVNYQVRGTTYNIQIFDPTTGNPFQFSDLDLSQLTGTNDPLTGFHNGNSSIYIGDDFLNALHLVDVTTGYGSVLPGLEGHIDTFNPMSGLAGFLTHYFGEVVPFYFNPRGTSGGTSCSARECLQQN